MGDVSIYRLDDPAGGPRCYIGASRRPEQRYKAHLKGKTSVALRAWMDELLGAGRKPSLTIIAIVGDSEAGQREREAVVQEIRAGREPLNGATAQYPRPKHGNSEHRGRIDGSPAQSDGAEAWQTPGRPPGGNQFGDSEACSKSGTLSLGAFPCLGFWEGAVDAAGRIVNEHKWPAGARIVVARLP